MRLSAPKQITWIIALILGVVGILANSGDHSGHHPRDWLLASGRGVGTAADRVHHTRLVVRQPRSWADRPGAQAAVVWPAP